MDDTYWHKQAKEPLFPDLLWSRPENKVQAGKLLIVGGNSHSFAAPATAFAAAVKASVGTARVLLPDSLKKVVGTSFVEAEFAPGTPSGSFSKKALAELLDLASWADGILLAGDFGRNSETAVLLDSFLAKYKNQVTVAGDGLDYFLQANSPLINRPKTASIINLGKLQKLAKNNQPTKPIRHAMSLLELVQYLHEWTTDQAISIITKHQGYLITTAGGQVSTAADNDESSWQTELPAYIPVWLLQNPSSPFKAITTAIYEFIQTTARI